MKIDFISEAKVLQVLSAGSLPYTHHNINLLFMA